MRTVISSLAISGVVALYQYQGFMDMREPLSRLAAFGIPILAALFIQAYGMATSGEEGIPLPVKLIRVVDGDTVVVDHMGVQMKVRVYGIDSPEKDQPYGQESALRLHQICTSGQLMFIPVKGNTYDRSLAYMLVDGVDVGLKMMAEGLAWPADIQYKPPTKYLKAHADARDGKHGLFIDANAVTPAAWRKQRGEEPKAA